MQTYQTFNKYGDPLDVVVGAAYAQQLGSFRARNGKRLLLIDIKPADGGPWKTVYIQVDG